MAGLILPTLRQLEYLVALSRRRSFSKAADDCSVSQSTLSSGIKELETLLDAQLVDRSFRGVSFTSVGEEAVTRAQDLLALAEDLARSVRSPAPLSGPLRLGVIPTIGPFLLPTALPLLRKQHPDLKLYLREDLTAHLIEQMSSGALDAALLAFPYDAPGFETIEIGDDEFVYAAAADAVCSSDGQLRTQDLEGENLLLLEDGHCLRDHAVAACDLQAPGRMRAFGATSLFTLVQMVANGLGATLLPRMAIDAGATTGAKLEIRAFADPAPSRRIGFAWRRGSSRQEDFELLADVFKTALDETRRAARSGVV